jgi:hypothetical protein
MLAAVAVVTGVAAVALHMPVAVAGLRLLLQEFMASSTHAVLQVQSEMGLFESHFLQQQPCLHQPSLQVRVGREQVN